MSHKYFRCFEKLKKKQFLILVLHNKTSLIFPSLVATYEFNSATIAPLIRVRVCMRVFLDYWRNEFLMGLMGRVQTLWDSGARSLITP